MPTFQFDCQAILRHGFGCFALAVNAVSDVQSEQVEGELAKGVELRIPMARPVS